jgi:hypothetical protein
MSVSSSVESNLSTQRSWSKGMVSCPICCLTSCSSANAFLYLFGVPSSSPPSPPPSSSPHTPLNFDALIPFRDGNRCCAWSCWRRSAGNASRGSGASISALARDQIFGKFMSWCSRLNRHTGCRWHVRLRPANRTSRASRAIHRR